MTDTTLPPVILKELTFYAWHKAEENVRAELRNWVTSMKRERDREDGAAPDGARAWLEEKLARSNPDSLYQTFVAVYRGSVVWTGSVVSDDRGLQQQFRKLGYSVTAFFGLFNTRYDLRGRGIGWAGTQYVNDFVVQHGNPSLGLVTGNPAAERHYAELGFVCVHELTVARRILYREGGAGTFHLGRQQ